MWRNGLNKTAAGKVGSTGHRIVRAALLVTTSIATCSANAQEVVTLNPTPPQRMVDVNSVDMASGVVAMQKLLVSGGDPARPLAAKINIPSGSLNFEPVSTYSFVEPLNYETWGSPIGSFVFRYSSLGPVPPVRWSVGPIPGGTDANGLFNAGGDRLSFVPAPNYFKITYADGETWTYFYATSGSYRTLKFVVSNRGYGLQFSYNTNPAVSYSQKITYYNKAYVYCDESLLVDCAAVSALPTAGTISSVAPPTGATYIDGFNPSGVGSGFHSTPYSAVGTSVYAGPGEQGLYVSFGAGGDGLHSFSDILKVEQGGVASSARTYEYVHVAGNEDSPGYSGLLTANDGAHTWHYTVPQDPTRPVQPFDVNGFTATDPDNHTYSASAVNMLGAPAYMQDQLGRESGVGYSTPDYRLAGLYKPDGSVISYTTDSRGNIVQERRIAKPGTGLADLIRTAGYDTTCTNLLTCNKANWVKDFKGNQTDITYNAANGALATVTGPADANGVRPQKRYTYVQRYAWILNSSGGYVHASTPIWLLESESYCRTSAATGNPAAACAAGANDEVKTVYDYGPDSGPNNLFLRGGAVTAMTVVGGVSALTTLRTCMGNDVNGRRIWATKPRANLASCS